MFKVAAAGEYHCHSTRIRCRDYFGIAQRAARLNRGRRTGIGGREKSVGKREESNT